MSTPPNHISSFSHYDYQAFFESSPIGGLVVNKDSVIIQANTTAIAMFGYEQGELDGQLVEALIPKSFKEQHYQHRKTSFNSPRQIERGTRRKVYALRKDGSRFPVDIAITPVLTHGRSWVNVAVVDITQRTNAEQERNIFKQQLQYMVDASDTIVYATKIENANQTTFTSDNVFRILGYTPAQMYDDPNFWRNHLHPEDFDQTLEEFSRYYKANGGTLEYRFRDASGTYHWVHDSFRVLHDTNQKPIEILGAWTDITRRKQVEHDRDQLEIELRLAHKLEAVGQLAAGVAHEINTPIQFVGDSVQFLKTAFDDLQSLFNSYQNAFNKLSDASAYDFVCGEVKTSEANADLDYLHEHVPKALVRTLDGLERITEIVRAMKEFAYTDLKEKSLGDINKALQNTLAIARNEYKYIANVRTELGKLPLVPCRIGELNQVFLNLIVNAAHAIGDVTRTTGEKGQIHITTAQEKNTIIIAIKDTGTGIPEDIRDRVFDPFFTTKEVGKGSGQGLALASSIIEDKHGGELRFESEVGHGTTFVIRLPIDDAAHKDQAVAV